jgi:hypothetical protein
MPASGRLLQQSRGCQSTFAKAEPRQNETVLIRQRSLPKEPNAAEAPAQGPALAQVRRGLRADVQPTGCFGSPFGSRPSAVRIIYAAKSLYSFG